MCQIRKSACVVVGIVAVLALGAAANADTKPWTDFDHQYDMSADPTTGGGLYLDGTSTLTTDSGLNVADMKSGSYYGDDSAGGSVWDGNFSDNPGYTIETRLKVLSSTGQRGAWAIYASTSGSTWAANVYIGASSVIYQDQQLGFVTVDTHSNTDAYHVFRANWNGTAGGIDIWRDGIQVGDLVTPRNVGLGLDASNTLYFGDWTGAAAGEALVDYVAFTSGAFAPVSTPEPSTIALLTSALVGLLAYAWRKRR